MGSPFVITCSSLLFPNGDPRDGFLYSSLTLMIDSYTPYKQITMLMRQVFTRGLVAFDIEIMSQTTFQFLTAHIRTFKSLFLTVYGYRMLFNKLVSDHP